MTSKLTGEGAAAGAEVKKKTIAIFAYKQRLLSLKMKTKIVQNIQTFIHSRFPAFV